MEHFRFADVIDIAVVAVLCYLGLSWVRRHASRSFLSVAILLLLLYTAARLLDLYVTSLFFQASAIAILVALLLIFQEDLRRTAERLALRRFVGGKASDGDSSTIDLIVEIAAEWAEDRIGALIVFPGRETLDRHIRGGETLDGAISRNLLLSIFCPDSPGHDGAVIVEDDRIARFGVHLPLSRHPDRVDRSGTRHAAALGLAENCDAMVVVVSEERGTISVAHQGALEVVQVGELKQRLERFFADQTPAPRRQVIAHWVVHQPGLKVIALCLSGLLWLGLAWRVEVVQRQYLAPIEYRKLPGGWAIDETRPVQARVILSGAERNFDRFDPDDLVISLDLSRPREGSLEYPLTKDNLGGAEDFELLDINPNAIRLQMYPVRTLTAQVRVTFTNDLPKGFEIAQVETQPRRLLVEAPIQTSHELDVLETEPVDLSKFEKSRTLRIPLVLPPRVRLADNQPPMVAATITIRPKSQE
jgi:uncharacterized protein (TIGR00159 family)